MSLVSIRMPKPLIDEMKTLVEKNNYLDLSEQIRSVIRQRARHYLQPQETNEPQHHRTQLRKQQLLKELKDLLEVDNE